MSEIWNSCYYNKKLKLLLVVYVDDFKMAGPAGSLSEGWKLIRQGLTMEEPEKLGVFLGCNHVRQEVKLADGRTAVQMRYEMESFMRSCVELYKELAPSSRLRTVDTPFLPEERALSPHGKLLKDGPIRECPWCRHSFPADSIVYKDSTAYEDATRNRKRQQEVVNAKRKEDDEKDRGALAPCAAKVGDENPVWR